MNQMSCNNKMENISIVNSIDSSLLSDLRSVSERYYEHKYCNSLDLEGIKNIHHRISFHSNKICMLSLSNNHEVFKNSKKIIKVNFEVDDKTDRMKNTASGKGKKGAQRLSPNSVICYVETEDGRYPVYSCIKGKLIEINEAIIENPNLLLEKPTSEGYIALLLPVLSLFSAMKEDMLDAEEYEKLCL